MFDFVVWVIGVLGVLASLTFVGVTLWAFISGYELEVIEDESQDSSVSSMRFPDDSVAIPSRFYDQVLREAERRGVSVEAVVEEVYSTYFEGQHLETTDLFVFPQEHSHLESESDEIKPAEGGSMEDYEAHDGAMDELSLHQDS